MFSIYAYNTYRDRKFTILGSEVQTLKVILDWYLYYVI